MAPLESGVPIRAVPNAQRLLDLGVSRLGLAIWAGELNSRRAGSRRLRVVAGA